MNKIYKYVAIECKVECAVCKKTVMEKYVNTQTIARIKLSTKDWRYIKGVGTFCPNCIEGFNFKDME